MAFVYQPDLRCKVTTSTFRCRASNTLIIRYEHNAGTEFEPLLETEVLLLQIADYQYNMP